MVRKAPTVAESGTKCDYQRNVKLFFAAAPLHVRAIALAAWAEWLSHEKRPKSFTIAIRVDGKRAEVTSFAPTVHACADGETEETGQVDLRHR
jgi:hypothetical protein